MLQELDNPRQNENEIRRLFNDDYFDLYVWYDEDNSIKGFQLCYDKNSDARALTWRRDHGYSHMRIDDGETGEFIQKMKPILVPDGIFNFNEIAEKFRKESAVIDRKEADFVYDKIVKYR